MSLFSSIKKGKTEKIRAANAYTIDKAFQFVIPVLNKIAVTYNRD